MNILEVSFLVADVIIFFGAVASYSRFRRLKKQVDILQTKLDSFQDNIYQLQTYQRYDLKFELDEIKNQQEKSQVTISKLGMDLKSIGENKVYPEPIDFEKLFEILHNNFGDTSKNTKPTDSVKNKVVKIIQDEQKPLKKRGRPFKKEQAIPATDVNEGAVEDLNVTRRKVKSDAKRVITTRELEQYFKEKTKLTYRGYVLKYGQILFQDMKSKLYKRLHYHKYVKKHHQ